MQEITFAVIGSGFMGGLLARVGHELPYTRCIAASDIDFSHAENLVSSLVGRHTAITKQCSSRRNLTRLSLRPRNSIT